MTTFTLAEIAVYEEDGTFTPLEAAAFREVAPREEPRQFALNDLLIRTKDKQNPFVTFSPNEVQERYLDQICPMWRDGDIEMNGLKEIILKARQFGFSTLIACLFFLDTINNPGTGTVVISNDRINSEKLFQMVERMYRNLPAHLRPKTQRANTGELYWPDIDCHYEVMTAGTKTSGRGWTINNLHCSEVGHWEYPEVFGGLLDSVPSGGNIFLESTANGEGSEHQLEDGEIEIQGSAFHVYYEKAKAGRSPYRANFFPWYEHSEYHLIPPADFMRTDEATEEVDPIQYARYGNETRIAKLYNLSDDQLYWRRQKIEEPGKGPAIFCQEYPANDVEAFRTSGKKFFAGVWDVDTHVREMEILPWWMPLAGFDHGWAVPYCFLLAWTFPHPRGVGVYVSDELYGARVRNTDQSTKIVELLERRAIPKETITVFADPAMWAKKGSNQGNERVGRADVEDYHDADLSFTQANNNRAHGCTNMREYMLAGGALYVSPRCVNLIRTIGTVLHDPHDLEVYETSQESEQHAVDTLRYLLNSRPIAEEKPESEPVHYFKGNPIIPLKELPPELQDGPEDFAYAGGYEY